jgi:hypothetical protein
MLTLMDLNPSKKMRRVYHDDFDAPVYNVGRRTTMTHKRRAVFGAQRSVLGDKDYGGRGPVRRFAAHAGQLQILLWRSVADLQGAPRFMLY